MRRRAVSIVAAVLFAAGCGRIWYDPVGRPEDSGVTDGAVVPADASAIDGAFLDGARPDGPALDAGADSGPPAPVCDRPSAPTCSSAATFLSASTFMASNDTGRGTNGSEGSCGGDAANEWIAELRSTGAGMWEARVSTDYDAVVYVRDDCSGTEIACVDAVAGPGVEVVPLVATGSQSFILYVDGATDECGSFRLQVQMM